MMFTVREIKLMAKGLNPFEEPSKVRFYAPVLHGRFKLFKNKRRQQRVHALPRSKS